MGVHKYQSLWPKKKTLSQKLMSCLARHTHLIILGIMIIVFIVMVMVCQVNAQADFLMHYGSG